MKKASLLLILASGALLASCGHHVLTPEEISSWEAEHSSSTPSSSAEPSSEPSVESIDITEVTSDETTEVSSEDTSEATSDDTIEDTSDVTSEDEIAYAAYLNGNALTLVDATSEIETGDTATEQWKAVDLDVEKGDVLTFTYNGEAIYPGASGEGNNAHYDEATQTITVRSSAEDVTLYFKVYSDGGYDTWLDGYTDDSQSDGIGIYVRGTVVGSWDIAEANELQTSADANNIGEILGITFAVGDFKIADSNWSRQWGWGYKNEGETADHEVVQGDAKSNFAAGASDNNIHCSVAGTYNLYLTTNNYLYIVAVE